MRIKNLSILPIFFISFFIFISNASSQTIGKDICQPSNGPLEANGPGFGMPCYTSTAEYVQTILKIGMCQNEPVRPTTSQPFNPSNCFTVYENLSQSPTYITLNQTTPLSNTRKPPDGSYQFIYVEFGTDFKIRVKKQFNSTRSGSQGGNGVYCWSENSEYYNWYLTEPNNARCGDSTGSPGTVTLKANSFWYDKGVYVDNISFPGTATMYLLKADGTLPPELSGAPNVSNGVARGLSIIRQNSTVSASTSDLNLAYNVSIGAILAMPVDNVVQRFGVGPTFPLITLR